MDVRDASGVLRTITSMTVRDAGGVLRTISSLTVRDSGNVLRAIGGGGSFGFSAVASPNSVTGIGASDSAILVTTGYTTVTVTGGVEPLTYSWANPNPDWIATDPDSPQTYFVSPYLNAAEISETDFICTITDANGATVDSNSVHAKGRNRGGTM